MPGQMWGVGEVGALGATISELHAQAEALDSQADQFLGIPGQEARVASLRAQAVALRRQASAQRDAQNIRVSSMASGSSSSIGSDIKGAATGFFDVLGSATSAVAPVLPSVLSAFGQGGGGYAPAPYYPQSSGIGAYLPIILLGGLGVAAIYFLSQRK